MTAAGDDPQRNLYAAPAAEVRLLPGIDSVEFYIVGRRKFLLLFLATFGLYQIYWFYRHWNHYRHYHGRTLWPIPRAIFAIFFTHSLVGHVNDAIKRGGQAHPLLSKSVATAYVVLAIMSNILERLSWREIGSPWTDWASLLVLFLLAAPLWTIQNLANLACGDPSGQRNARLTGPNWIWLILGALLWALVFVGLLLPEAPPG